MNTNLSKDSSDFIRASYSGTSGGRLKASHACELVAAFFGYKSHAALLTDKAYPLERIEEARIFIPDIPLLDTRRLCLNGLPDGLLSSFKLASKLSAFLKDEGHFVGEIWLYESLESYVMEQLLHEKDNIILDDLSGEMAGTNACFEDPYYRDATISDDGHTLVVTVEGTYSGTSDPDKPFCGDQIDMQVTVTLQRIAGRRGFLDFEISAEGSVNDERFDPDQRYGTDLI